MAIGRGIETHAAEAGGEVRYGVERFLVVGFGFAGAVEVGVWTLKLFQYASAPVSAATRARIEEGIFITNLVLRC